MWLKSKIEELKEFPDIKEQSGFIESVGWVKVKQTIPQKLNELSQRMGISYGKCKIARRMTWKLGIWYPITNDIHLALRCIMLPEEYLEAICAHELTHCLVPNHQVEFWQTFEERAGEHLVRLDMRFGDGCIPYRWRSLKWHCRH